MTVSTAQSRSVKKGELTLKEYPYCDYISAEVTLVWTASSDEQKNRLIFAVTELIPKSQLASKPLGIPPTPYLKNTLHKPSKTEVRCRRFYCAVETALGCFERFDWSALGGPQNLLRGGSLKRQPSQGFSVVLPRGHTPLGLTESSLSMVLPNRSTSFRAYGFVKDKLETELVFSDGERNIIQKFLRKYCGVDLKAYREYWGASILCMSNPILWDYKSFGVDAEGQLCLLLLPRDGRDVTGMRYMIHAQHLFGATNANISEVTSKVLRFPFLDQSLEPQLYLWDKQGSLLEVRLLSFCGPISHSTWRRHTLPNGESTAIWPADYYESRQQGKNLLQQQEDIRMYQSLEKKGQFFYFRAGEITRACHTVGKLLTSAGLNVTICDMYLNGKGFDDCVKGRLQCGNLTIFAAKSGLQKKENGSEDANGEQLVARLSELVGQGNVCSARLYGVTGGSHDQGLIHDRFLIVDGTVYCLGSSLDGLGGRDTVLFKSPNPQVFSERIEEWKKDHAVLLWEGGLNRDESEL